MKLEKALERAYKDVENNSWNLLEKARAYEDNAFFQDKPFFIASHSQGTLHGQQLISKHIDGTNLSKRIAYLIGCDVKNIEICKNPKQTNCVIAWCTVDEMANLEGESWTWDPNGWKRLNRDELLFGTNP